MALRRCIANFSTKNTATGLRLLRSSHEGPREYSCGESSEKPPCPPCPPPNRPPCIQKQLPSMYEVEVSCKPPPAGNGPPCPCEPLSGGKDCTNYVKTNNNTQKNNNGCGETKKAENECTKSNETRNGEMKTSKEQKVDKSIFDTFGGGIWGRDGRNYRTRGDVPPPKINKRKTTNDICSPNRGSYLNPCMNKPTVKLNILRPEQKESLSSRVMKNLGIDTKSASSPTAQGTQCDVGMKAGSKEWCNKPGLVKPGPIKCKPQTLAERLMHPPDRKLHTDSVHVAFDTKRRIHTRTACGNSMSWYTRNNKTFKSDCNVNKLNNLKKCSCPLKSKLKCPITNNKCKSRALKSSALSCQSSEQQDHVCPIISLLESYDKSGCTNATGSCSSGTCPLKALLNTTECPWTETKKCPLRPFINASNCECGGHKCPLKALIHSGNPRSTRLPWQNTEGYKVCPVLPQDDPKGTTGTKK